MSEARLSLTGTAKEYHRKKVVDNFLRCSRTRLERALPASFGLPLVPPTTSMGRMAVIVAQYQIVGITMGELFGQIAFAGTLVETP